MKKILCTVLVLLLTLSLAACKQTPPPQKEPDPAVPAPILVLERLQKACNETDIDSALACIDPIHTQKVKGALGVAGLFMSDEQIIEKAASMYLKGEAASTDVVEICKTVKITPKDTAMETETATVTAVVTYQNGGIEYEGDVELAFVCKDGTWYVTGATVIGNPTV